MPSLRGRDCAEDAPRPGAGLIPGPDVTAKSPYAADRYAPSMRQTIDLDRIHRQALRALPEKSIA
jgi:hypothetical protein